MQSQATKFALSHAARQPPFVDEPVDEGDTAQLRQQGRVEIDLVDAAYDLARAFGSVPYGARAD